MADLGEVIVHVDADASGFQKTMAGLKGQATASANAMVSAFNKVGSSLTGAQLAKGLTAGFGQITNAAKAAARNVGAAFAGIGKTSGVGNIATAFAAAARAATNAGQVTARQAQTITHALNQAATAAQHLAQVQAAGAKGGFAGLNQYTQNLQAAIQASKAAQGAVQQLTLQFGNLQHAVASAASAGGPSMFNNIVQGARNAGLNLNNLKTTASGLGNALALPFKGIGFALEAIKAPFSFLSRNLAYLGGAIYGVKAIASTFVSLTSALVGSNANLEQTKVAFTGLLGSAKAADTQLQSMRRFAAATPFEFPDLVQSTRLLLAFGFQLEDIEGMLRSIGDAVSFFGGGAAEIDRVTRALGQMQAKGRVLQGEVNQLAEVGINAYAILADQMGISIEQVAKLSHDSKLLASDAIPLLLKGLDESFGGGMARQAQTLNGLISTIKDNLTFAFQDVSYPIFEVAKEYAQDLAAYTSSPEFAAKIASWAEAFDKNLQGVIAFAETHGPAIAEAITNIATAAANGTADVAKFFATIAEGAGQSPREQAAEGLTLHGPGGITEEYTPSLKPEADVSSGRGTFGKVIYGAVDMAKAGFDIAKFYARSVEVMNKSVDEMSEDDIKLIEGWVEAFGTLSEGHKKQGVRDDLTPEMEFMLSFLERSDDFNAKIKEFEDILAIRDEYVTKSAEFSKQEEQRIRADRLMRETDSEARQKQLAESLRQYDEYNIDLGKPGSPIQRDMLGLVSESGRDYLETQQIVVDSTKATWDENARTIKAFWLDVANDSGQGAAAILDGLNGELAKGTLNSVQAFDVIKEAGVKDFGEVMESLVKMRTDAQEEIRKAEQKRDEAGIETDRFGKAVDLEEQGALDKLNQDVVTAKANVVELDALIQQLNAHSGELGPQVDAITASLRGLALAQDQMSGVMETYAGQAADYKKTGDALTAARDAIIAKQERNIKLDEKEQDLLADYPQLHARLEGGIEDATIQEGYAAEAKATLMLAQDDLNDAIARGDTDLTKYTDHVQEAKDDLGKLDPLSGNQFALETLTLLINDKLIVAVQDLIKALKDLDGTTAEPKIKLTMPQRKEKEMDEESRNIDYGEEGPEVHVNTELADKKLEGTQAALDWLNESKAEPIVAPDDSQFQDTVPENQKTLDRLNDTKAEPKIEIQGAGVASKNVHVVGEGMGALNETTAEPHVVLNTAEFDTGHEEVLNDTQELDNQTPKPDVGINKAEFDTGHEEVLSDVKVIDAATAEPDVSMNTTDFDSDVGYIHDEMGRLDGLSASGTFKVHVDASELASLPAGFSATRYAKGGLVKEPTLAIVGEAGPELVIPLDEMPTAAGAKIMSGDAEGSNVPGEAGYGPFLKSLLDAISALAEGFTDETLEKIKSFADTASSGVQLILDTLGLFKALGETIVIYTPEIAANIGNLDLLVDLIVKTLTDSAAGFEKEGLEKTDQFASTAQACVETLSAAFELLTSMGDTQVQFGDWQKTNIANLKFIVEKIVQSIMDSANLMQGDGLSHAQVFSESAQAAIQAVSDALDFVLALGDHVVLYGDWQATNIANLKFVIEKIVQSISDSANLFKTEGIAKAQAFSEAASAAVELMMSTLDLIAKLGDTVVLYGDWQANNIANLKFIVEKIVQSIGDSAAAFDDQFVADIKDFADGASAAISLLTDTLDFLDEFEQLANASNVSLDRIATVSQRLGERALLIANTIAAVAQQWNGKVNNEALSDFAAAVGDAVGIASDVLGFLTDLVESEDAIAISSDRVARVAQKLSDLALIVANAFKENANAWDGAVNEQMTAFSEAVGAATSTGSDTLGFLNDMLESEDALNTKLVDVAQAATQLSKRALIIAQAVAKIAADWDGLVNEQLKLFTEAASASLGLIGETLDALTAIADMSEDTNLSAAEVADAAELLAGYARIIADAFVVATDKWDTTVTPAITDFANAAGASLDVISAIPDAIEAILSFGKIRNTNRIKSLAPLMVDFVKIIIRAVEEASHAWTTDGIKAIGEFADGAGKAVSLMGGIADTYESMLHMRRLSARHTSIFKQNFLIVLQIIRQLAQEAKPYVKDAESFLHSIEIISQSMQAAATEIAGMDMKQLSEATQKLKTYYNQHYVPPTQPPAQAAATSEWDEAPAEPAAAPTSLTQVNQKKVMEFTDVRLIIDGIAPVTDAIQDLSTITAGLPPAIAAAMIEALEKSPMSFDVDITTSLDGYQIASEIDRVLYRRLKNRQGPLVTA